MFESKSGIFLVAGLGFFFLAFLSNAIVPALMYSVTDDEVEAGVSTNLANQPEKTVEELINPNLRYQFEDLAMRFPEQFKEVYGTPENADNPDEWWNEKCAEALTLGHKIYVGEGCWHCHSQFVRPVSNESKRWGPVAKSEEYENELQRPVMFGTRRVGPDLSREGGRRSNDWHAVHFFRPRDLSQNSPMPEYPWFFDGSPAKPNERGLAIMTYVQWLGSWLESYPLYEQYDESSVLKMNIELEDAETVLQEIAAEQAGDSND
ncbi:MAG: cbb3-type cytochrome c oxidase subunit II [Planctomycetaceae bacterium]|nr:cbb3-type cytochrome c oxidase subunit II [Planctomycetaceae bacterium]